MGSLRKRGNVYWMRYYRNGQRLEESARTESYEEARELLRSREGKVADGRPVSPKAAKLRFEDAAADVVTDYTINDKDLGHLQTRLTRHLLPHFRGRRLVDINTADIRAYIKVRLQEGAAHASVNRELSVIGRAFRLAKQAGRFVGDVPYMSKLKENNTRCGFFERGQLEAVKRHLPEPLQGLVELAYLTGWRMKAEIFPLEWRQVDWEARALRLDPGTTKNDDGREYPMTAAIEAVLTARHEEHQRLAAAGRIVPFVFHRNGKRIRNIRKAWLSACEAAGLPGRYVHDFRRSNVRNLERDGVSRSAAMDMVGHKTESIYRRYAIVDAAARREAADKIDRAAAGRGDICGDSPAIAGTVRRMNARKR